VKHDEKLSTFVKLTEKIIGIIYWDKGHWCHTLFICICGFCIYSYNSFEK